MLALTSFEHQHLIRSMRDSLKILANKNDVKLLQQLFDDNQTMLNCIAMDKLYLKNIVKNNDGIGTLLSEKVNKLEHICETIQDRLQSLEKYSSSSSSEGKLTRRIRRVKPLLNDKIIENEDGEDNEVDVLIKGVTMNCHLPTSKGGVDSAISC